MFISTKLDKSIDAEFIKEFCNVYYPELRQTTGVSIVGHYVLLQKNPWVCALFFIKHHEKNNETQVIIAEDGNLFGRIFGSSIIRLFTGSDFYADVHEKLKEFIKKEKNMTDSDFLF